MQPPSRHAHAPGETARALDYAKDNDIDGTIDMVGLLQLQDIQIRRRADPIEAQADLLSNRVSPCLALAEPF